MNKSIAFLVFVLLLNTLLVQSQKYDFNWIFGYDFSNNPSDTVEGINFLDFNTATGNPIVKYNPYVKSDFHNYGCLISDYQGRFLFSFDGYEVEDYTYKYLLGAIPICPDRDCEYIMQGSSIIPKPGSDSSFYLLNEQDETVFLDSSLYVYVNLINYSELFETKNHNGIKFKSVRTNILNDSFDIGKVAYCKHANGRDWWILVPGRLNNKFYTLLADNMGIKLIRIQHIGLNRNYGGGYSCFSQNGEYYVITTKDVYDEWSGSEFDFYLFDRNNGELSNHQNFKIDSTESISAGCAFSPSNMILYICSGGVLYQYPLVDNKLSGRIEIARYDGFLSHLFGNAYGPTYFGQLQNGPDNRIYCNSNFLQTRHLHVINKPDELGHACDFKQHEIPFPSIKKTMPYFPNYRLGPLDGSICDTLGIDNFPWAHWRYDQDTLNYLKFEFTDLSACEVEEWYWDFGDPNSSVGTSRDTNPIHTFSQNGVYEVCLIVKNKNGADTLCRTITIGTVSTQGNDKKILDIQIWPNPCKDFLIINVLDYNPQKMVLQVYNSIGELVLSKRLYQGSNSVDVENLNSGIYFISILERGTEIKSEKLIKL